jgi:hypothetical protein
MPRAGLLAEWPKPVPHEQGLHSLAVPCSNDDQQYSAAAGWARRRLTGAAGSTRCGGLFYPRHAPRGCSVRLMPHLTCSKLRPSGSEYARPSRFGAPHRHWARPRTYCRAHVVPSVDLSCRMRRHGEKTHHYSSRQALPEMCHPEPLVPFAGRARQDVYPAWRRSTASRSGGRHTTNERNPSVPMSLGRRSAVPTICGR